MLPTLLRCSRPFRHPYKAKQYPAPSFTTTPLPPVRITPDVESRVVYENDNFLIYDKPGGAAIQGSYGTIARKAWDAVVDGLRSRPDSAEVFVVHRLDRSTTGLMLFAKTPMKAKTLGKQFHSREVQKTYLAVVHGHIASGTSGVIDDPLSVGEQRVSRCEIGEDSDSEFPCVAASTKWECLTSSPSHSLLKLLPSTGRKHQLRVHCADSLKCGIIGDFKYAPDAPHRELFDLPPDSMLLHSYAISFHTWEKNGKRRTIDALVDPPATFTTFARLAGLDLKVLRNDEPISIEK